MAKIKIPPKNTKEEYDEDELMWLECDKGYCIFHLTHNREVTTCYRLKGLLLILDKHKFKRIHDKYAIHVGHVEDYNKRKYKFIIMKDGKVLPIAKRRKTKVCRFLETYFKK